MVVKKRRKKVKLFSLKEVQKNKDWVILCITIDRKTHDRLRRLAKLNKVAGVPQLVKEAIEDYVVEED